MTNFTGLAGKDGLSEQQLARLATLERVTQPSGWMRGELVALRMYAGNDAQRRRCAALEHKWGQR